MGFAPPELGDLDGFRHVAGRAERRTEEGEAEERAVPVRRQDAHGDRPLRAPALEVVERGVVNLLDARVRNGDVRVAPERAPGVGVRAQQAVPSRRAHGRNVGLARVERVAEHEEEADRPPWPVEREAQALVNRLGARRGRVREHGDGSVDRILLPVDGERHLARLERGRGVERQARVRSRPAEHVIEGVALNVAGEPLLHRDHGRVLRDERRGVDANASRVHVLADRERVRDVERLPPADRLRVRFAGERDVFFDAPERGELAVLGAPGRAVDARQELFAHGVDRLVARHVLELAVAVVDQHADVAVRENRRGILPGHRIRRHPLADDGERNRQQYCANLLHTRPHGRAALLRGRTFATSASGRRTSRARRRRSRRPPSSCAPRPDTRGSARCRRIPRVPRPSDANA